MKTIPNEISMRQASIFELRTLARNMGVNSPTTYKKEELISKMLKIINGEEKPEVPKSRAGRPPKQIFSSSHSIRDGYNVFNEDCAGSNGELLNKYNFSDPSASNGISILKSPKSYEHESGITSSSFDFESRLGYLQSLENQSCFIFEYGNVSSVENVVNIGQKKVDELFLRNGDLIKVLCKKDSVSGNRYFAELEEFESEKYTNKLQLENRPIFEHLPISIEQPKSYVFENNDAINNSLKFLNNALCGSRNVLLCQNLRGYKDIINVFRSENKPYSVINICLEVLPEEEGVVKNGPNFESFYTHYGDFEKQNNHTIALAIDRIQRLAELGKNVIVIVNEIGKVIKFRNFALGLEPQDLKYKSFDNVSKLMTLARNFENGNSISIFALLKEDKNNLNFSQILNELDNLNCDIYKI